MARARTVIECYYPNQQGVIKDYCLLRELRVQFPRPAMGGPSV